MRHHGPIVLAALALAALVPAAHAPAHAEGRFRAGAMLWRDDTPLKVTKATDYDGTDITAGERALDWRATGSGVGGRVSYEFPRLLTVYGEVGSSQATVRDQDVLDPSRSVTSRGLSSGAYFSAGAQISDYFSSTGSTFWKLGGELSSISAGLDRDVDRRWDYGETRVAGSFKIGAWVQQVGFYGGVRAVHADAEFKEIDRSNPIGQQVRTTNLGRDGAIDLLVGAQTRGPEIAGFTEIGMVGTFSANAGLAIRF